MQEDLLKLLITSPPACSEADAESLAADYFSKHVRARLLSSERDQNFRLEAGNGERFTLKISSHEEQQQIIDFQNCALAHISERDASIPVPRVIAGQDGCLHYSVKLYDKTHIVRLLSWLDGQVLYGHSPGPVLAAELGGLLARLGLALRDFEHPGSDPPLLWDMKHASRLAGLLEYIENPGLRKRVEQTLARFAKLQPTLASLRTQVIYNDLNPDNVLMDKNQAQQISGIIDFGDMVKSPLIIDLAVASAYQLAAGDDPLAAALPLIAGYHAVNPLQGIEMELLPDLIRTRLVTSMLIMSWRMQKFPQNRDYLMRSQAPFRRHLEQLADLDTGLATARIQAACSKTQKLKSGHFRQLDRSP